MARKRFGLFSSLAAFLLFSCSAIAVSSSGQSASASLSSTSSTESSSFSDTFHFSLTIDGDGVVDAPGEGDYRSGTSMSLSATPSEGNLFRGFFLKDSLLTDSPTFAFSLIEDMHIVASFEQADYQACFSHRFAKANFVAAGGVTTINGLQWTYSSFAYLGSASIGGVQIGSEKSPQIKEWAIQATFPSSDIIVESYSFELATALNGSASYSLRFGDYQKTEAFSNQTDFKEYAASDLSVKASSISLSLVAAAKAIYFYSFRFSVKVPASVDFPVYEDELTGIPVTPGTNGIPSTNYSPTSVESYYAAVDLNQTGQELLTSLRSLVSTMTKTSYGDAKTMLQYVDENPVKPGFDYGMWDGDDIFATWDSGGSWNREHVWSCAHLKLDGQDARPSESDKTLATDLHNLRVACPLSNEYHSDKYYDEANTSTTFFPNLSSGLINGHHAYQGDFRGDVARILFYMAARYDGLVLKDVLGPSENVAMGKLTTLLAWNAQDGVDAFERQRNERIYSYQGNRNPFIDFPSLASAIW